jgi:hypothetical protein
MPQPWQAQPDIKPGEGLETCFNWQEHHFLRLVGEQ